MRVLITGSEGYLGKILQTELTKHGHAVFGFDNYLYNQDRYQFKDNPPKKDITSIRDMYKATKGMDVVVALAAIVGDPACALDEEETVSVNFEATRVLKSVCETNNVKKIIFASSCSVYGDYEGKVADENAPVKPLSL